MCFFLSFIYISRYFNIILKLPVRIEVVARFVSQRSVKIKAAFVDEKFDELSKKKKRKKPLYLLKMEYNALIKKCNAFSPGD